MISVLCLDQRWRSGVNSPTTVVSPRGEEEMSDDDELQDFHFMSAKFHFVDLAGSERAHRTGNAGERFKGASISCPCNKLYFCTSLIPFKFLFILNDSGYKVNPLST